MYSAGTFRGSHFRTARIALSACARQARSLGGFKQNRATRERSVRIEDHLDLRDIRIAVRHARRGRPAVEVALRQPRIERRSHRHRHVRSVVMRQSLRSRGGRLGRRGGRRLALADQLGDRVRVEVARRLGLLRRRLLRPLGRRIEEFWPHGRLNRRLLDGELRRRRRLAVVRAASVQAPAEASPPLWAAAGVSAAGSRLLAAWAEAARRGLRFGRRGRRRLWRGRRLRGRAQICRRRRRRGRGLWRGFGVLFAIGDLIEFAQRNGFNRDRFGSVCELRSRGEAEQEQRQQRPVQRCGACKIRI